MNKLLILFFLIPGFRSICQEPYYFHDLVNNTHIQYIHIDEEFDHSSLDLPVTISYIQLNDNRWAGATKINALIQKQVNELKTPAFAARFNQEYDQIMKPEFDQWHRNCAEKSPNPGDCGDYSDFVLHHRTSDLYAGFVITSLCDHILIGGMNVSAGEAGTKLKDMIHFQDLHYYDLVKGIEINPSTILIKEKQGEFHQLIRSRIPEHLRKMADTLDLKKGLPLFNGTGFYYFLEGNIEANTDEHAVLQVRLSLGEVQPFLNPNGPFKAYLAVKATHSKYTELMYDERFDSSPHCLRQLTALKNIEKTVEYLSGNVYKNKTVYISEEGSDSEWKMVFNQSGKPVYRKLSDSKEHFVEDSLVYSYYPNGKLKATDLYQPIKLDGRKKNHYELRIVRNCQFDERQNLVKDTRYKPSTDSTPLPDESRTEYYNYFNDQVFTDTYMETSSAAGYGSIAAKYGICDGSAFLLQLTDDPLENLQYTSRRSGKTTFVEYSINSKKPIQHLFYNTKKNRMIACVKDGGQTKLEITYNSKKLPVGLVKYRKLKTDFEPSTSVTINYDSESKINSYVFEVFKDGQKSGKAEVYLFRYE